MDGGAPLLPFCNDTRSQLIQQVALPPCHSASVRLRPSSSDDYCCFFDFRQAQRGQAVHKNWKKDKKISVHYITRHGPDALVAVPPLTGTLLGGHLHVGGVSPDEEIRAALLTAIHAAFSMSKEEAISEALSLMGFRRITPKRIIR